MKTHTLSTDISNGIKLEACLSEKTYPRWKISIFQKDPPPGGLSFVHIGMVLCEERSTTVVKFTDLGSLASLLRVSLSKDDMNHGVRNLIELIKSYTVVEFVSDS